MQRGRWSIPVGVILVCAVAAALVAYARRPVGAPSTGAGEYQQHWWPIVEYMLTRMDQIADELRSSGTPIATTIGTHRELAAAPQDTVNRHIRTFDFGNGSSITAEIQPALLIKGRVVGEASVRVWAKLTDGYRGLFLLEMHAGGGGVSLHREDDALPEIPEYRSVLDDPRPDAAFAGALDGAIRSSYARAMGGADRE